MKDKQDIEEYKKIEERHTWDVETAYKLGQFDMLNKLRKEFSEIKIFNNTEEKGANDYSKEIFKILNAELSNLKGE